MFKKIKNILRKVLFAAGIDITKNQQYDRLTLAIMKKVLTGESNCIDIGCHKGEVLDEMIKFAPKGHHVGFEPIPEYFRYLTTKYHGITNIQIHPVALSNEVGKVSFNWVKNAPAYSGLKEREYAIKTPDIEKIEVNTAKLDDFIQELPITHLIKIDVEGAEMKVLQGAETLIQKHKPVIIFECGKGAADYYGTTPEMVFDFFNKMNYTLYSLKNFVDKVNSYSLEQFCDDFNTNKEYYFVAVHS